MNNVNTGKKRKHLLYSEKKIAVKRPQLKGDTLCYAVKKSGHFFFAFLSNLPKDAVARFLETESR